ncbi:MAG: Fic family protein [Dehalococcoidia bacterium]
MVYAPGGYWAFVPHPLPPRIEWDDTMVTLLSRADLALGKLSGLIETVSHPDLLVYSFVRREAVFSSRINGVQSSLSDLLLYEVTQVEKQPDVKEIYNYVRALEYGLDHLDELPLNLPFLRERHGVLMKEVNVENTHPGEFRNSQIWNGPPGCTLEQAIFVPPPVDEMYKCLNQMETFFNTDINLPYLVQAALIHYQLESIRPFLDGNGRIGRLLILFLFYIKGVFSRPLLYLSAYLEQNREEYFTYLLEVSRKGNWKQWIHFVLQGVISEAEDTVQRAYLLLKLHQDCHKTISSRYRSPLLGQIIDHIFTQPVVTVKSIQEQLKVTFPAANKAIQVLARENILTETTGRKRNKVYVAQDVLDILVE